MGVYLNSRSAYTLFCEDCASTYYVDKTDILAVGIAYNKNDEKKRYECKVEVLRESCSCSEQPQKFI